MVKDVGPIARPSGPGPSTIRCPAVSMVVQSLTPWTAARQASLSFTGPDSFFPWPCCMACGILAPWPGIRPAPSVLEGRFLIRDCQGSSWARFFTSLYLRFLSSAQDHGRTHLGAEECNSCEVLRAVCSIESVIIISK